MMVFQTCCTSSRTARPLSLTLVLSPSAASLPAQTWAVPAAANGFSWVLPKLPVLPAASAFPLQLWHGNELLSINIPPNQLEFHWCKCLCSSALIILIRDVIGSARYTNFYKACIRCSLIVWILLAVLQRGTVPIGVCWVPFLFLGDQIKAGIRNK